MHRSLGTAFAAFHDDEVKTYSFVAFQVEDMVDVSGAKVPDLEQDLVLQVIKFDAEKLEDPVMMDDVMFEYIATKVGHGSLCLLWNNIA